MSILWGVFAAAVDSDLMGHAKKQVAIPLGGLEVNLVHLTD
jgi:hypothetical protein